MTNQEILDILGSDPFGRNYLGKEDGKADFAKRPIFMFKGLIKKYGLGKAYALRISAALNLWMDIIESEQFITGLSDMQLHARLKECTLRHGCTDKYLFRCCSKACPWCRSVWKYTFRTLFAVKKPKSIEQRSGPISDRKYLFRPPEHKNTLISVRNIVYDKNVGTWLCNACYFNQEETFKADECISDKRTLKHYGYALLDFDFNTFSSGKLLAEYLKIGKRLKMLTNNFDTS